MSGVRKVSDYEELVEAGPSLVVITKASAKLPSRGTALRGVERYIEKVETEKWRKDAIRALITSYFRIAIAPRNIDYCVKIAESVGLEDEDEEEELILQLENAFENGNEKNAFAYEELAKRLNRREINSWFARNATPLTDENEGAILEMVNYLVKVEDAVFENELERVRILYEVYGNDAFPWRLPSIKPYSDRYIILSQLEEEEGENYYEEQTPCRNNNCGSKRSIIHLYEDIRTDNGKRIIKNCVKCGAVRH